MLLLGKEMTPAKLFDQAYCNGMKIGYPAAKSFCERDLCYLVQLNSGYWQDVHKWCKQNFDEDYSWAGGIFAFKTEEDALLFKLAWG